MARIIKRENEGKRAARLSRFRDASPQQIQNYIDNNVTDLASAKAVLAELAVIVSYLAKQQIKE